MVNKLIVNLLKTGAAGSNGLHKMGSSVSALEKR